MAKLVNSFNFKNANSKIKPPGEGLPRYIHYNADQSGCGFWRMLWPASQLLIYNKAVVSTSYHMVLDPNFYKGIDAVRLQRQCTENQYRFVKHLRKISNALKDKTGKGFKLIWEVDDVVCPVKDIPDYNKCKEAFTNPQISDTVKRIVHCCDEMSVVSNRMKMHYSDHLSYDKISVIPNYFMRTWADGYYNEDKLLFNFNKNKKKLRIGYAGSPTHFDVAGRNKQVDDFSHVVGDIIKRIDDYQFVFFGGYPKALDPYVKSGKIEYQPWGNLDRYFDILDGLNLNVMIAPLYNNTFSASKSNIKFYEAAALGIPCITQDIDCYDMSPWKFNSGEDLFEKIKLITLDENTYSYASKLCRSMLEECWLDEHLDEIKLIYDTPFGDPIRMKNKFFFNNNKSQFSSKNIETFKL